MFTRFMDMYSGGGRKEKWGYIYIEAPMDEAKVIFYNRFGHNPERVACTCCGEDYSIKESETLEMASAYDRGCRWSEKLKGYDVSTAKTTVDEYEKSDGVLVIRADQIKDHERQGEVPTQGYVWQD